MRNEDLKEKRFYKINDDPNVQDHDNKEKSFFQVKITSYDKNDQF